RVSHLAARGSPSPALACPLARRGGARSSSGRVDAAGGFPAHTARPLWPAPAGSPRLQSSTPVARGERSGSLVCLRGAANRPGNRVGLAQPRLGLPVARAAGTGRPAAREPALRQAGRPL